MFQDDIGGFRVILGEIEPGGGKGAVVTFRSGEKHFQLLSFAIFEIPEFQAMKAFREIDEGESGRIEMRTIQIYDLCPVDIKDSPVVAHHLELVDSISIRPEPAIKEISEMILFRLGVDLYGRMKV